MSAIEISEKALTIRGGASAVREIEIECSDKHVRLLGWDPQFRLAAWLSPECPGQIVLGGKLSEDTCRPAQCTPQEIEAFAAALQALAAKARRSAEKEPACDPRS